MNHFHQIPNKWSLEISRDGDLRSAHGFPHIPSFELMEKYKGLIPKFLASTFIGPIDLPIAMMSNVLDGYKLTYVVKNITQLSDDDFDFDGYTFKRIPGFSDYIISESGVVWSLLRHKFMYVTYNHAEYMTVTLMDDTGFTSPRKVHRLVYATYVGPLDPNLVIDHKDDYRGSNHWSNLQQITTKENTRKTFLSRNNPRENIWRPETIEKKRDSVLSEDDVHDVIRRLGNNERIIDIAHLYNCSTSTISKIRNCKTWKHVPRDNWVQRLEKAVPETFTSGKK